LLPIKCVKPLINFAQLTRKGSQTWKLKGLLMNLRVKAKTVERFVCF